MSDKFTPGPWTSRPTGMWPRTNHHLGIYANDALMPQVAKVEGKGYLSDANARLIAAAPDLFEALKDARRRLFHSGLNTEFADIAIRKAVGNE